MANWESISRGLLELCGGLHQAPGEVANEAGLDDGGQGV